MTGLRPTDVVWMLLWVTPPLLVCGCAHAPVMSEVDLSTAQWRVWSGQALWEPGREQPSVVGEVLLALHETGDTYINLAKPPLEIFAAQTHGRTWSVHLIENDKTHRGRGKPPKQFIWFYLPSVLAGQAALDSHWQVDKLDDRIWTFANSAGKEKIRLVLDE